MYDVVIVGAGPGGIFTAYELLEKRPDLSIAVFEMGNELTKRHCPIDGDKVKSCIHCKNCSIMSGFGGAGAFSDGKYNITNDFGGTLYEYIGKKSALELKLICRQDQSCVWWRRNKTVFYCRIKPEDTLHAKRFTFTGCFCSPFGNRY